MHFLWKLPKFWRLNNNTIFRLPTSRRQFLIILSFTSRISNSPLLTVLLAFLFAPRTSRQGMLLLPTFRGTEKLLPVACYGNKGDCSLKVKLLRKTAAVASGEYLPSA